MTLDHPEYLWLLALLPLLVLLLVRDHFRIRRALMVLGGRWEDPELQGAIILKGLAQGLVLILFHTMAVLSVCGISWGETPVEEDRKGSEVVFCLDSSLSMLAQDMGSSTRMDRARELVRSTIQDLPGLRSALVLFRGEALVLVPMTEDTLALQDGLEYAGPAALTNPGTSLQAGLATSIQAFDQGSSRHRSIVLISDGENLQGDWSPLARELRRTGVLLLTVAMGSTEGSRIFLDEGKVVLDSRGNEVITRKNPQILQEMARQAGGVFLDASSPGIYSRISQELRDWQNRQEQEGFRLAPVRRDNVFILASLCFLVLFLIMGQLRWRKIW